MLRNRSKTSQEKRCPEQANIIQAHYSSNTKSTLCQNPSKSPLQVTTLMSFYPSGGSLNTLLQDSPTPRTGPNFSSPQRSVVTARRNKRTLPSSNTTLPYSIIRTQ